MVFKRNLTIHYSYSVLFDLKVYDRYPGPIKTQALKYWWACIDVFSGEGEYPIPLL